MGNNKNVTAFTFGLFMISFSSIIFIYIIDRGLSDSDFRKIVGVSFVYGAFALFIVGLFFDYNWIASSQFILAIMLVIFLSYLTNVIIGLGVGVLSFFVLTNGISFRNSGDGRKHISMLSGMVKWLAVTIAGSLVSIVIEQSMR